MIERVVERAISGLGPAMRGEGPCLDAENEVRRAAAAPGETKKGYRIGQTQGRERYKAAVTVEMLCDKDHVCLLTSPAKASASHDAVEKGSQRQTAD